MIAAVTARAFVAAAELAPAGVDVRRLPDGRADAVFVVLGWEDRETIAALPGLERLRVVQTLSAGTDWIEASVPAVAEWVLGALLGDAYGQFSSRTRRWSDAKPGELHGATVPIVGLGSIGAALKQRFEASA